MTRKTKLEKLRETVENANARVKESFVEYDALRTKDKENMDSSETSDLTIELVKVVIRLTENMNLGIIIFVMVLMYNFPGMALWLPEYLFGK